MPVITPVTISRTVKMILSNCSLTGDLHVPADARGLVLFAMGCGNSRQNPRNIGLAKALNAEGMATLVFDLLTFEESEIDAEGGDFRFNVEFLAHRLSEVTYWAKEQDLLDHLPIGYVGAGIGAPAAFIAAETDGGERVKAIVSRGGRLDLAPKSLFFIKTPSLLIVGENDVKGLSINSRAYDVLHCEKDIVIVPGAGHVFEDSKSLHEATKATIEWFKKYM